MKRFGFVAVFFIAGALTVAQTNADRVTVPFSDPSRPGTVKVNLIEGGMTVKGSSGKDVIVTMEGSRDSNRNQRAESSGLRRLGQPAGLHVEEENNVMSIGTGWSNRANVDIQVPAKTNLRLSVINGDAILVDGVEGDLEVTNVNGSITLTNIIGAAVAHATNGKVLASLRQVMAQKPMSFTSLNGDVDVTLPPSVKANLKLRSDNGEVFTDFDVQVQQGSKPTITERRGGGRRLEIDNSIYGSVNGGGPEFELRSFNGNIYLRKAK